MPTIYDALDLEPPEVVKGYTQHPIEGVSFAPTFNDASAKTGKNTQFYSMGGTMAIWSEGWKATNISPSAPDMWAEYADAAMGAVRHRPRTRASATTWPTDHPEKLQELI